jgi:peroxiredoxin
MEHSKLEHIDSNHSTKAHQYKTLKMCIKNYFIIAVLSIAWMRAVAQVSSNTTRSTEKTILLLPDGTVLGSEKLDSLKKAWGEDRIRFRHNQEDDAKGIVHLVRMTDEMKQQVEDENTRRNQAIASMLNKPAPDFELTDLQGHRWTLHELRGKIVVLNFWFTSCAPCIQEMPELNELVRINDSKNVVFLGLTFNNADQIKTFLKKRTFNYTLLPDSREVDKKFQVSLWPTSIVIDKDGYVKLVVNSNPKIREELTAVINSLK